jgi:nucleotide-binding universal stress UspA family protein
MRQMYTKILVPLDGSRPSQRGLEEAIALAAKLDASLHLLNVVDARLLIGAVSAFSPPDQLLQDWRDAGHRLISQAHDLARDKRVASDTVVRCEPAMRVCDVIVDEARRSGAGLIVMGTHGRHGLKRVALGSDAELVVRDSPVPVLLVRGDESPAN